jgi:dTDP-glucose 4,6-dehydratase
VRYCIDIDGVLCSNTWGEYERAEPDPAAIAKLNEAYDAGHTIILFTARGSTTGIDWRPLTETQLRNWGARYHELRFGKPEADVYVDDRALAASDWLVVPLPAR